jgi:transmembrane sensor
MTTTPPADETAKHEFDAFLRTQDPINVAATLWHTRREQGLNNAEETEFQAWLAADPAHKSAFTQIDESLELLRKLPAARVAHLRHAAQVDPPLSAASDQRRRGSSGQPGGWRHAPNMRRAALALCGAAILAIGVHWQRQQPVFIQSYTAERGQRLEIPLPDGSALSLDSATQVQVTLYRDRREVRLEEGEALFSVSGDATRPFEVQAGSARVTVVGTRFSVRYRKEGASAGAVDVEVEAGHVQVAHATPETDTTNAPVDLFSGESVRLSPAGTLGAIRPIAPDNIAPWRKGFIRFTNTPLAEALQEMERYGPTHLVIRDPAVAALPIGGNYRIGNPNAFARILPQILPVRLVRREDGKMEIVGVQEAGEKELGMRE